MNDKCRGCSNEFKNLKNHIKKSFPCQNYYAVDETAMFQFSERCDEEHDNKRGKKKKMKIEEKDSSIVRENSSDNEIVIEDKNSPSEYSKRLNLTPLESQNWLNDEVINEYLRLLNTLDKDVFMFSTYFHTGFREGGFRRVKHYYKKHDLLGYKTLYIPVHQADHWFLITFDGEELVSYDPYNYPGASEQEREKLLKKNVKLHLKTLQKLDNLYFKLLFKLKKKKLNKLIHRIMVPPNIPAQTNSWDCGVFLAAITKCLVLNEEFNFGTESMVSIRNIMKKELDTKKIEAVFLDKRRGLGLLPAPINWDTQYQKKPGKSCSKSLSTIKNESNKKTMTNEVESGNIIRLKPITDKPENKAINQHVNSISNENVKSSEEKIRSMQCFTFDNFGIDTVFETNGIDTVCIGCLKQFKRIIAHLQKSKKCMEKVDFGIFLNAMTEIKKDIKNEKDRLRRLFKTDTEKAIEANRKKLTRELKSNAEKEIERENKAKRMKICRELKSTVEKETEKENAVKRMKICRGLKSNVEKETEKENKAKGMKICRGLKSKGEQETEKENEVKRIKLYRKRKREEDPDSFLEQNKN